jgi:hypothetical protein
LFDDIPTSEIYQILRTRLGVTDPSSSAAHVGARLNVGGLVQTDGVEGGAMADATLRLAATSLIRAALLEDFETAELIISQHDLYELTRTLAVISAQGWTITNGYNIDRAVKSLDVLASVFAREAGVDRREYPR